MCVGSEGSLLDQIGGAGLTWCWYVNHSGKILNKLKSKGILESSVSTYDFSSLYTTLPHYLINDKLIGVN